MENKMTILQEETQNLPDDVMIEHILPRLSVKSLIRYKSVCKIWQPALSSPHFAKSQLKFSCSSPQFLLFLRPHCPPCRVVMFSLDDECNRGKDLVNLNFNYNGREIYVVGSYNGLVCLYDKHDKLCLWNPVTCHYNYISVPKHRRHEKIIAVGFGYIPSIDDYKIVCLISSDHNAITVVYIYSLSTAKWDNMSTFDNNGIKIAAGEASVVVNDTLYWPPIVNIDNRYPVVGVNLLNGKMTKLPLMGTFSGRHFESVKMLRMKGRLSFCCKQSNLCVVWMLKRDGSGWMKLYDVYPRGEMEYLHSSESGKCLIVNDSKLMLLDPSDPSQVYLKKYKEEGLILDGSVANALEYKASLLSPFGTASAKNEGHN